MWPAGRPLFIVLRLENGAQWMGRLVTGVSVMSHHIVEVKHLQHVYADGTVALQDVSFTIHHGESVAIIGANGAGKSTLLLHLNGYLTANSGRDPHR